MGPFDTPIEIQKAGFFLLVVSRVRLLRKKKALCYQTLYKISFNIIAISIDLSILRKHFQGAFYDGLLNIRY